MNESIFLVTAKAAKCVPQIVHDFSGLHWVTAGFLGGMVLSWVLSKYVFSTVVTKIENIPTEIKAAI